MLSAAAIGAIVLVLYLGWLNEGTATFWSDTYEYAQVARNLVAGRGLTTSGVSVLEFAVPTGGELPIPYFLHEPGQSLLLAALFWIFGSREAVVGWATGLCFALLVPVTCTLASDLFGRRVGWIAAVLVATNPQLLRFGVTGLAEVPIALLVTLLLLLVYRAETSRGQLAAGVAYGALLAWRLSALTYLPWLAALLAAAPGESRPRSIPARAGRVGLFLFAASLVFAPVALRNQRWFGAPFENLLSRYALIYSTSAMGGPNSEIFSKPGLDIDPVAFLAQHPEELWAKLHAQLRQALTQLMQGGLETANHWGDAFLILLFLMSVLVPPPTAGSRQRAFRLLFHALVATSLLAGGLTHIRWRHLYALYPVMLIYVGELLVRLAAGSCSDRDHSGRRMWFRLGALVALVTSFGLGLAFDGRLRRDAAARAARYQALARLVDQHTPPRAIVLIERIGGSLPPSALAWYSAGERVFVQYSPFTFESLTQRPRYGSRPVFVLRVLPNRGKRNVVAEMETRGFAPAARSVEDGETSLLFVREGRRRTRRAGS